MKYKNFTKITKVRAIIKPAKGPPAHEVYQSTFCTFFQLLIDTKRLIIMKFPLQKEEVTLPKGKEFYYFDLGCSKSCK